MHLLRVTVHSERPHHYYHYHHHHHQWGSFLQKNTLGLEVGTSLNLRTLSDGLIIENRCFYTCPCGDMTFAKISDVLICFVGGLFSNVKYVFLLFVVRKMTPPATPFPVFRRSTLLPFACLVYGWVYRIYVHLSLRITVIGRGGGKGSRFCCGSQGRVVYTSPRHYFNMDGGGGH